MEGTRDEHGANKEGRQIEIGVFPGQKTNAKNSR
jgi:hypothetical protein